MGPLDCSSNTKWSGMFILRYSVNFYNEEIVKKIADRLKIPRI